MIVVQGESYTRRVNKLKEEVRMIHGIRRLCKLLLSNFDSLDSMDIMFLKVTNGSTLLCPH